MSTVPPTPEATQRAQRRFGANGSTPGQNGKSAGANRGGEHREQGSPEAAQDEPGNAILDDIEAFLRRFVAYPSEHARVAHALWIAHTHLIDVFDSTPRLAFLSPEPASGKTRGLEVSELLVPRPVEAINVTAAYLFRKVDDSAGAPTILFDEIDTVFGPKAREHEDVRGLLNAGHRKGAVAGRCIVRGKTVETVEFPAYCAVALAGLGDLPDTILTRSVVIRMRRRGPRERVEPFRRRLTLPEGYALRDRIAGWATLVQDRITWPEMPAGVEDRDADVWEALLAVADAAGGEWPERARSAARALVAQSKESTPSLGIRLLADLRTVFGDRDAMSTDAILTALNGLDEAPWSQIADGKPLNARGLSGRLRTYEVKSRTIRVGDKTPKGYAREDLADAWARYLPDVADPAHASDTKDPHDDADVADVADVADSMGDQESTEDVADPADRSDTGGLNLTNSQDREENETDPSRSPKESATSATSATRGAHATRTAKSARACAQCGESLAEAVVGHYCERHGGQSRNAGANHAPKDCGRPTLCAKLGPCPGFHEHGACPLAASFREASA